MKAKFSKTFTMVGSICNFCKKQSTKETPIRMIKAGFMNVCEHCFEELAEKFKL